MFSLPSCPYLMHGLAQIRETITLKEFSALPIQENDVPIVFEQLKTQNSLKLQFVVMPFHPESLQQKIESNQSISEVNFLHYSIQLCKGLQHLHQHNFVHCDIKPSNVLISSENKLVIIDFGMAGQIGSILAGGNALYSPPESNSPIYKVATSYDVFGAGIIMYELLSGQQPFSDHSPFLRWKVPPHTFPMIKTGLGKFTLPSIYYDLSVKIPIKEVVNRLIKSCNKRNIGENHFKID